MTGPASLPRHLRPVSVVPSGELWRQSFRSMASDIELVLAEGCENPEAVYADVVSLFEQVAADCTRFDPLSDLMLANAAADEWWEVGRYCYAAIEAAAAAHLRTAGRFDPRVLDTLVSMGYDRSIPFGPADLELAGRPPVAPPRSAGTWQPGFDSARSRVRVGPVPIDLGGIGKGLAVRWAAALVAARCPTFLIDAGGDCFLGGDGPDGTGWSVGIEDPRGATQPVAVLAVRNSGCATSSVRLRKWQVVGKPVHHLIDPMTGQPGGDGLLSVTVIAPDPADAEVWSKVLFLAGADGIGEAAAQRELAALWVHEDGSLGASPESWPLVTWYAR